MKPSIIKAGLALAMATSIVLPATAQAVPDTADPDTTVTNQLAGKTVFLDPGHQGSQHSEDLSRQVDDGRGGTKECQTTGTTTLGGVPEHTVAWKVSQLVKASLESLGAKVILSRNDDTGWGGCIDERAKAASDSGANVAVSIHADGAPADARGFHLIVPQLPVPNATVEQVQSGEGRKATDSVRDAYKTAGFSPANYAGAVDGIQTRNDIAGPALTTIPLVFLEMGNGQNTEDAAQLESPDGQLKHAIAITTGIVGYLLGGDVVIKPARGTPPPTLGDSATSDSRTTDSPSTESSPQSTKPKAKTQRSTPSLETEEESGTGSADGGITGMAMTLVTGLLEEVGLGSVESLVDEEMIGLVGDLASQLVGIALE